MICIHHGLRFGHWSDTVVMQQEGNVLSRAAMEMLREAGVDAAVPMDGLPSGSFPGTFYHPPGHVWDWTKDEMVLDSPQGEADSPGKPDSFCPREISTAW